MARADSAAVVENTVIATCSLISKHESGRYMWGPGRKLRLTERSGVHKSPKGIVSGSKTRIKWPRDNFLQNDAQYVRYNLKEKRADINSLRPEVLIN